jgi:hypothetical protein
MMNLIEAVSSVELDVGSVVRVGPPVRRDDVGGNHHLAGVAAEAEGEGALKRTVRVHPPDVAPRLTHRHPVPRVGLHEVHLHHGAVLVGVLDEHRQVVEVGIMLHVEVNE